MVHAMPLSFFVLTIFSQSMVIPINLLNFWKFSVQTALCFQLGFSNQSLTEVIPSSDLNNIL